MGGMDLSPTRAHCKGALFGYGSNLRYLIILCVFSAVLYYGWPFIEAILTLLHFPDVGGVKAFFALYVSQCLGCFIDLLGGSSGPSQEQKQGYSQFEQVPGTLMDDDDEEMEDMEDVGGKPTQRKQGTQELQYNDDDSGDNEDGDQDLLQLDESKPAAKPLRKPKN